MKDNTFAILVDIDGTICEDIPNEQSERFATAKPFLGAAEGIKAMIADGNSVTYFTARREEHREVTEQWLKDNGFPNLPLIMNKPRIEKHSGYVWIDNHRVKGLHFSAWDLSHIPEAE